MWQIDTDHQKGEYWTVNPETDERYGPYNTWQEAADLAADLNYEKESEAYTRSRKIDIEDGQRYNLR